MISLQNLVHCLIHKTPTQNMGNEEKYIEKMTRKIFKIKRSKNKLPAFL